MNYIKNFKTNKQFDSVLQYTIKKGAVSKAPKNKCQALDSAWHLLYT